MYVIIMIISKVSCRVNTKRLCLCVSVDSKNQKIQAPIVPLKYEK